MTAIASADTFTNHWFTD